MRVLFFFLMPRFDPRFDAVDAVEGATVEGATVEGATDETADDTSSVGGAFAFRGFLAGGAAAGAGGAAVGAGAASTGAGGAVAVLRLLFVRGGMMDVCVCVSMTVEYAIKSDSPRPKKKSGKRPGRPISFGRPRRKETLF